MILIFHNTCLEEPHLVYIYIERESNKRERETISLKLLLSLLGVSIVCDHQTTILNLHSILALLFTVSPALYSTTNISARNLLWYIYIYYIYRVYIYIYIYIYIYTSSDNLKILGVNTIDFSKHITNQQFSLI